MTVNRIDKPLMFPEINCWCCAPDAQPHGLYFKMKLKYFYMQAGGTLPETLQDDLANLPDLSKTQSMRVGLGPSVQKWVLSSQPSTM